jgi:hypothetical protein
MPSQKPLFRKLSTRIAGTAVDTFIFVDDPWHSFFLFAVPARKSGLHTRIKLKKQAVRFH